MESSILYQFPGYYDLSYNSQETSYLPSEVLRFDKFLAPDCICFDSKNKTWKKFGFQYMSPVQGDSDDYSIFRPDLERTLMTNIMLDSF